MLKFADMLHKRFIAGHINGAVFSFMNKFGTIDNKAMVDELNEHIDLLVNCNIGSINECEQYFKIYASLSYMADAFVKNNKSQLYKYAFINRNKYNLDSDVGKINVLLDFLNENKDLIKSAYPNNMGIEDSGIQMPQYNVNKWVDTMREIYQVANTNNFSLDEATKQATANWDKKEEEHFLKWMRYYQEGNYSKYNVKTAQFFMNKQDQATDAGDVNSKIRGIMNQETPKTDPGAEKKRRIEEARRKLRGRLKSVEELLEQYRDVLPKDVSAIMRKDVYDLKEKVLGLELRASLVDSIMRTSNKFNKHGFIEGAQQLKKIAQEVATDTIPEVKEELPALPAQLDTITNEEPQSQPPPEPQIQEPEPEKLDVSQLDSGFIAIPDFSTASYRDALITLERVNQIIAEKNVVRAIAAVDIILASLGIASHFPELSEAQIKLMDSFQYASTRISSVISQLRGSMSSQIVKQRKEKEKEKEKEREQEVEKQITPQENKPAQSTEETTATPVVPPLPQV